MIGSIVRSVTSPIIGVQSGGAAPPATDEHYASVISLLHMNGTDGVSAISEDGPVARTWTVLGTSAIDDAQAKFGDTSFNNVGNGNYATTPYSADFLMHTVDFTVEAWCYATSWATWEMSGYSVMLGNMGATSFTNSWSLGPLANGKVNFRIWTGVSSAVTGTTTLPLNTWNHVAMTRIHSTSTYKIWVNGVGEGSFVNGSATASNPTTLTIGSMNNTAFNGWVDDIRITRGVARYTTNFTPPTIQHPDSA